MTRVPWSPEARWEAVAVWRSSCCHSAAPLDSSGMALQQNTSTSYMQRLSRETGQEVFYLAQVCIRLRGVLGVEKEDSWRKGIPSHVSRAYRHEVGTRRPCQKSPPGESPPAPGGLPEITSPPWPCLRKLKTVFWWYAQSMQAWTACCRTTEARAGPKWSGSSWTFFLSKWGPGLPFLFK